VVSIGEKTCLSALDRGVFLAHATFCSYIAGESWPWDSFVDSFVLKVAPGLIHEASVVWRQSKPPSGMQLATTILQMCDVCFCFSSQRF